VIKACDGRILKLAMLSCVCVCYDLNELFCVVVDEGMTEEPLFQMLLQELCFLRLNEK